jgi:hypothetical protein
MKRNLELTPGSKYADVWQSANYLHVSEAAIRKWLRLEDSLDGAAAVEFLCSSLI